MRRFWKCLSETDFWWVLPAILGVAAGVLAVLDAIDPNTPDYRMWSVGCLAAMLVTVANRGSLL